ncbi:MAG: threonine aldolase family protein, partial [Microthrixaceae bacterium]
ARLEEAMAEVFERPVGVHPVPTGTAANALALAAANPVWGTVLCHDLAHIAADECSAPTVLGGGLTLTPLPAEHGRLVPATIEDHITNRRDNGVHTAAVTGLSITQATEFGTRYSTAEVKALCSSAHARGLSVHCDGARFANAVASSGATPAELTWRAGIDLLSFGATKGGAMAAEAVIVFTDGLRDDIERLRKRSGHLLSKQRFVSAQFNGWLEGGNWLARADHANECAQRLARGLSELGIEILHPVEANMVYPLLSPGAHAAAQAAGASYYVESPPPHDEGMPIRLVTSWSTNPADVDQFLESVASAQ